MGKTKFLILISILFLTFSLNSFAQTNEEQIDLTGKWALQFQIDRYFTLDDFQGGTFSGKYHLNNSSAFRLGVSLANLKRDEDLTITYTFPDTTIQGSENALYKDGIVRFDLQYLHYSKIVSSVSMFLGVGVSYQTTSFSIESTMADDEISATELYDITSNGYGLSLLIGVEWFVKSNIGISAEYGSGYYSTKNEGTESYSEEDNSLTVDINGTESGIEYHRVKFGVSIYF